MSWGLLVSKTPRQVRWLEESPTLLPWEVAPCPRPPPEDAQPPELPCPRSLNEQTFSDVHSGPAPGGSWVHREGHSAFYSWEASSEGGTRGQAAGREGFLKGVAFLQAEEVLRWEV